MALRIWGLQFGKSTRISDGSNQRAVKLDEPLKKRPILSLLCAFCLPLRSPRSLHQLKSGLQLSSLQLHWRLDLIWVAIFYDGYWS